MFVHQWGSESSICKCKQIVYLPDKVRSSENSRNCVAPQAQLNLPSISALLMSRDIELDVHITSLVNTSYIRARSITLTYFVVVYHVHNAFLLNITHFLHLQSKCLYEFSHTIQAFLIKKIMVVSRKGPLFTIRGKYKCTYMQIVKIKVLMAKLIQQIRQLKNCFHNTTRVSPFVCQLLLLLIYKNLALLTNLRQCIICIPFCM